MMQAAATACAAPRAPVSLALVGLGRQGARHLVRAQQMCERDNLRLAAIVDTDPRCAEHALRSGIDFFPDIDRLPAHVDAAIVATPTCTHLDVGGRLLERGIDLLIEKPVASGLAQTQALVRLAERHGCIFQVGYLERYHHAFRAHTPDFSAPARIASHRTTRGTTIGSVAELVLELMIHDLDMVATWLDRTPSSFEWTRIERGPNRVCAQLEMHFGTEHHASLLAESGVAEVVRHTRVTAGLREWHFDWAHDGHAPPDTAAQRTDPISAQLHSFVHAVRTRTHPLINGHSALKAMQLAEYALQALPENA